MADLKPSDLKELGVTQTHHERYKETKRKWYEKNKEKAIETAKAWRLAHPERHRELKRNWARENRVRNGRRRTTLPPLPDIEYQEILQRQGGVCAICDAFPTPKRLLDIDREWPTGKIRGLLCKRCFMGTRYFHTIKRLEQAIRHYKKHGLV